MKFVEENCCIQHEGQTFCSGGAHRDDNHALVYISDKGVTDWHGNVLGTYEVTSKWRQWPPQGGGYYWMTAVRVTFDDGTKWYGRYGSDWSQACRLRRCKH